MQIKKQNTIKDKIITKLSLLISKIDNSGDSNLEKNGELNFINEVSKFYNNENTIVFDVGANIGKYTKLLLDKLNSNSKYYLFEPQNKCNEILEKLFKNEENIALNKFALSNTTKESFIYYNEEKSGLASLHQRNLDFYNLKMDKSEKILLKRADDYIRNSQINKINLLKIDVEGHEIKTLEGFGEYLNPDFIDFIQFEYGGANIDSHTNLLDLYTILSKNGFSIFKVMKHHLEERKYNPRMENFVYQNYIAISNNILKKLNHEK